MYKIKNTRLISESRISIYTKYFIVPLYDLAKTSYFRDVFGEEERDKFNVVVVNINADFLAPVFFSDELMIETTVIHLGHKSLTMLQRAFNKASGVLKCQCRTVLVGYDILTKEPMEIPMAYKQAICDYEGKTLSELSQPIQ